MRVDASGELDRPSRLERYRADAPVEGSGHDKGIAGKRPATLRIVRHSDSAGADVYRGAVQESEGSRAAETAAGEVEAPGGDVDEGSGVCGHSSAIDAAVVE